MPVHRKCFLPQISQHGQFPFLPRGMNVRSKQGSFLPFSTFLPLQGTITINHLIVFFFVIIPCLYCVSRRAVVLAQINWTWKSHVPFSSCACRLTWNCPYLLSVYRRLLLLNHDDGGQICWTNWMMTVNKVRRTGTETGYVNYEKWTQFGGLSANLIPLWGRMINWVMNSISTIMTLVVTQQRDETRQRHWLTNYTGGGYGTRVADWLAGRTFLMMLSEADNRVGFNQNRL